MAVARFDYVLVGAGLQNGLIALALVDRWPGARIALLERAPRAGGNHTWSVHAAHVPAALAGVLEPLVERRWPGTEVRFPGLRRAFDEPYLAIPSSRLDAALRRALGEGGAGRALWTDAEAVHVGAREVRLADGRALQAEVVIDARGPDRLALPAAGYQKFVGVELELQAPIALDRPVLMDATVAQRDGYRFVYLLPYGPRRVLVEDTTFSDDARLDRPAVRGRALAHAAALGMGGARILREEDGVLPLPLVAPPVPPRPGEGPLAAGYGGGWFHPTTGYSFPVAARLAAFVAATAPRDLGGPAWDALVRGHRRQVRFALLLNRLLFRATRAADRWRVLERFHRLPPATVARFYALETTRADRLRILCGRPPRGVSIRDAVRQLGAGVG